MRVLAETVVTTPPSRFGSNRRDVYLVLVVLVIVVVLVATLMDHWAAKEKGSEQGLRQRPPSALLIIRSSLGSTGAAACQRVGATGVGARCCSCTRALRQGLSATGVHMLEQHVEEQVEEGQGGDD
jgi:hypothetical protein